MKAVVTRKAEKAVVPRNATIRSLLLATCHLLVVIMLKVMEKRMKNRGKNDFCHMGEYGRWVWWHSGGWYMITM